MVKRAVVVLYGQAMGIAQNKPGCMGDLTDAGHARVGMRSRCKHQSTGLCGCGEDQLIVIPTRQHAV